MLNLGFRPFYLLAALFAALSLPLWIAQYFGVIPAVTFVSPMAWHMHEMVFGFVVAVVTGFLFTAARNWTGLPTPSGGTLAVLAGLWLLGRALMLTGPAVVAAAVDTAFLPAVAWFLWRPLHQARNRNRFFVAILLALALTNALFHASHLAAVHFPVLPFAHAGLALLVLIVAIMAGRVIPSFTRNALRSARVRSVPAVDIAALVSLGIALAGWVGELRPGLLITIVVVAAVTHAIRLGCWDPWSTRRTPILWILHASYAWIPAGLTILAVSLAGLGGSHALAVHALAVGAIGGMIIGMMTRTARGHTGLPLRVGRWEVAAYASVQLAAAIRVLLPLAVPSTYAFSVLASAVLWSAAFLVYFLVYAPWLVCPRLDGQPG